MIKVHGRSWADTLKMARLFYLFLSFASNWCGAQPVITASDAPEPTAVFAYHRNVQYAGLFQQNWVITGPDATWTFLPSPFDTSGTWAIEDPSNTDNGFLFPSASVAHIALQHPTVFEWVSADEVLRVGEDPGNDTLRVFTEPARTLVYPCALGTAWTDEFAWFEPLAGAQAQGSQHDTADGYGSLQLPWGTMGNVLALRETVSTWIVEGGDSVRLETLHRRFLRPGFPVDVASAWQHWAYLPGDTIGDPIGGGAGFLGAGEFLGMPEDGARSGTLILRDERLFLTGLTLNADQASVFDTQGRVELRVAEPGTAIDIGRLAPGVHMLLLTEQGAPVGAWRFVKP